MDLDLIPLRNGVLKDVRLNEVVSRIVERLVELKLVDRKYIGDAEFILYMMNMIEHLVAKKDGIDKKTVVLSIFKNHYSATEPELKMVESILEFLHSNKRVKKVSYYKIFKTCLREWFRPVAKKA
jgi:hypothetical protein